MCCALLYTQTATHHGCYDFLNSIVGAYYKTDIRVLDMELMWNTMLCSLGMQQYAMHNATIQKTALFKLGVLLNTG